MEAYKGAPRRSKGAKKAAQGATTSEKRRIKRVQEGYRG